jgi:glutathione S-transferase
MKLYYTPGACSLSSHIIAREAGMPFELKKVGRDKKVDDGSDFNQINPKSYVPTLQLDDGTILTENAAIAEYLADQRPESGLAPKAGTFERYRLSEWLHFIGTEVHKQFAPFFHKESPEEWRKIQTEKLTNRFGWIATQLEGKPYLMGETFSAADGYLYAVLRWTPLTPIKLEQWPALKAYFDRVTSRPRVQEALLAEGLVKSQAKHS